MVKIVWKESKHYMLYCDVFEANVTVFLAGCRSERKDTQIDFTPGICEYFLFVLNLICQYFGMAMTEEDRTGAL